MDILVIGSLNMDVIFDTPRMPAEGETILGGRFATAPGGKGANQAVAAARLAHPHTRVRMAGCLGDDAFGGHLRQELVDAGADCTFVRTLPGVASGVALILLENGLNRIIVASGANAALSTEQIDTLEPMMRAGDILLIQLEIPLPAVQHAVALARSKGMRVLLNPAPAPTIPLPDDLLAQIDILTPNESECAALTGLPCTTPEFAAIAARALRARGVPQVVVTLGGQGVLYNRGDVLLHRAVPKVSVIDTTAAGDAFSGALAVALAEGMDIDAAVDFANATGTCTVMKAGAQPSLPFRTEVDAWLAAQPPLPSHDMPAHE